MKGKGNWVWCRDDKDLVTLARRFLSVLGKLRHLYGCHTQLTKKYNINLHAITFTEWMPGHSPVGISIYISGLHSLHNPWWSGLQ